MMASQFKEGMGIVNQLASLVAKDARENKNASGSNYSQPPRPPMMASKPFANLPTAIKLLLCFLCRSKDHLMWDCPKYKEYLSKGWLVPEGPNSQCVKLRDEVRMPKDDPDEPRWVKIERIAKDRNWDGPEAYFANLEEDEPVWKGESTPYDVLLTQMTEIANRLGRLEVSKEEDTIFN